MGKNATENGKQKNEISDHRGTSNRNLESGHAVEDNTVNVEGL
jgi:hypothetical protein